MLGATLAGHLLEGGAKGRAALVTCGLSRSGQGRTWDRVGSGFARG